LAETNDRLKPFLMKNRGLSFFIIFDKIISYLTTVILAAAAAAAATTKIMNAHLHSICFGVVGWQYAKNWEYGSLSTVGKTTSFPYSKTQRVGIFVADFPKSLNCCARKTGIMGFWVYVRSQRILLNEISIHL
jgi:hypothetical protein